MSSLPILIHGAGGAQGAAVVRAALASGMRVRVMLHRNARNPFGDRVEIARGDLADIDSLRRASEGVSAAYLVIPVRATPRDVEQWGRNAIDAAMDAGVQRLVFNTSTVGSDAPTGVPGIDAKLAVERRLQVTPMPSVILRTTIYMGNLTGPWLAPGIVQRGVLACPLAVDQRVSWISWDEAARYAVAALGNAELAATKAILQTGGPEALTGHDVAETLGRTIGRRVSWLQVPLDRFEAELRATLGASAAADIVAFYRWVGESPDGNPLAVDSRAVQAELPVARTTLAEWARSVRWQELVGAA